MEDRMEALLSSKIWRFLEISLSLVVVMDLRVSPKAEEVMVKCDRRLLSRIMKWRYLDVKCILASLSDSDEEEIRMEIQEGRS